MIKACYISRLKSGAVPGLRRVVTFIIIGTAGWSAEPARQQTDATSAGPSKSEVVQLSAFNVNAEKDYGYRVTNAATATRVGTAIINTPLNIQVISGELIDDLNVRQVGETLNYISGATTDKVFADGDFIRLRGQPIGAVFRNGFRRSLSTSTENIERVEVVKGPSTVFFGEGNPGGIVNYITKRPEIRNAGSIQYSYGSYDYHKAKLDVQTRMGSKAGVRVIAAYEDSDNWIDFSYNKAKYAAFSAVYRVAPTTELFVEYEVRRQKQNDGFMNLTSNRQFHADYDNPPADVQARLGMTAAQLRNRWRIAVNQWALDVETTRGNRPFTITENVNDYSPRGIRLNLGGEDLFEQRNVDTFNGEIKHALARWFDVRYAFNWIQGEFDEYDLPPTMVNGDRTIRLDNIRGIPYSTRSTTHQLDLLLKHASSWGNHKLLAGAEYDRGYSINRNRAYNFNALAPVLDRTGATLTGLNVYRFWDPFLHAPVKLREVDAGLSPNYSTSESTRRAYYVTHQGEFLSNRLHTMIGARRTEFETVPGTQTGPTPRQGINEVVPTYGVSFRVFPALTAFASYSKNFIPTIRRAAAGPGLQPGEDVLLPPEQGKGWDLGLKTDFKQNLLSGTVSVFELDRQNIVINDIVRRENDPRNLDNDPNNNVTFQAPSGLERSRGVELDVIWSPTSRLQLIAAYAYMWMADQVSNPSLLPGTYEHRILIGRRLRTAPEHKFSLFAKYTFTDGLLKGLTTGSGVRYTGEQEALSQNAAFDLRNAASTVFDGFIGYRMKVFDRAVGIHLAVDNIFDEEYVIGNRHYGDPLKVFLRTKLDW